MDNNQIIMERIVSCLSENVRDAKIIVLVKFDNSKTAALATSESNEETTRLLETALRKLKEGKTVKAPNLN